MTCRPHVLVLAADRLLRLALRHRFEHEGYRTDEARDCSEAKELLLQDAYDLIVAESHPPKGSWGEIADLAQASDPYVEVLLMSDGVEDDEPPAPELVAGTVRTHALTLAELTREAREMIAHRRAVIGEVI